MKRLYFFLYCLLCFVYSQSQETVPVKKDVDKLVSITNADYDMGKISTGKPLEYNVVIKNISKDTVVLQDVKAGCGCTTPKFRAGEKILPGKSTYIVLGFNGDAHGEFVKTVDIIFGGGLVKQVKFRGVTFSDSTAVPKPILN
jgi:hypothetical protein